MMAAALLATASVTADLRRRDLFQITWAQQFFGGGLALMLLLPLPPRAHSRASKKVPPPLAQDFYLLLFSTNSDHLKQKLSPNFF